MCRKTYVNSKINFIQALTVLSVINCSSLLSDRFGAHGWHASLSALLTLKSFTSQSWLLTIGRAASLMAKHFISMWKSGYVALQERMVLNYSLVKMNSDLNTLCLRKPYYSCFSSDHHGNPCCTSFALIFLRWMSFPLQRWSEQVFKLAENCVPLNTCLCFPSSCLFCLNEDFKQTFLKYASWNWTCSEASIITAYGIIGCKSQEKLKCNLKLK